MLARYALCLFVVLSMAALAPSDEAQAQEWEYSSYYGFELAGSLTASGEPFEPYGYTAASWEYDFGTLLQVCYPVTGACTVVRVNDRGPGIPGRTLDLSLGAAEDIGLTYAGVGWVYATPVGYTY